MRFTEKDGQWYELGGTAVWKIKVYSQRATALSFQFMNLHLPGSSEMWLYSETRKMVMGPILPEYVRNGILPTDQIFGEEVTVAVTMPASSNEKFTITVANVIHGIKKIELEVRDYGDSEGCNNDIACEGRNDWEDVKDGVCLIFAGQVSGTGTLINSACQTIRPYILTANHIVEDVFADPVHNWVFRFGYESSNCGGDEPSSWISFNGADLRSSWDWDSTDFALLELQSEVRGYDELVMVGWNRQTNPPDNELTTIHHPASDVKKYHTNTTGWKFLQIQIFGLLSNGMMDW